MLLFINTAKLKFDMLCKNFRCLKNQQRKIVYFKKGDFAKKINAIIQRLKQFGLNSVLHLLKIIVSNPVLNFAPGNYSAGF